MKKLIKENSTGAKGISIRTVNYIIVVFITVLLFFSACSTGTKQDDGEAVAEENQEEKQDKVTANATLEATSGSKVTGEVNFAEENGNVRLELNADNLTPGEHAVHLHEKGDCSAEDASSAGGHWNPAMKPHGKRGGGGSYHKGDIGNMTVGNDGKGTLSLSIEGWSIGGSDSTNIIGKSVIIHEKADDFTSQPAGNAGARISCGVIKN
ncbi:MAG: superoxide dismutase family protein [Cyclobacteriaceae bacterium]